MSSDLFFNPRAFTEKEKFSYKIKFPGGGGILHASAKPVSENEVVFQGHIKLSILRGIKTLTEMTMTSTWQNQNGLSRLKKIELIDHKGASNKEYVITEKGTLEYSKTRQNERKTSEIKIPETVNLSTLYDPVSALALFKCGAGFESRPSMSVLVGKDIYSFRLNNKKIQGDDHTFELEQTGGPTDIQEHLPLLSVNQGWLDSVTVKIPLGRIEIHRDN